MTNPRAPAARRVVLPGLALAGLFVLGSSCREPTQMKVSITLDFDCSDLASNKVSLRTGSDFPGSGPAQTQSKACQNRTVGTVVLKPTGAGDRVAIEIVAALTPATLDNDGLCAEGTPGCIHARRALSYVDGNLDVPIQLQKGCAGQTCKYDQTCVAATCVDAATLTKVDAGVSDAGAMDGPAPDASQPTNLLKDAEFKSGCLGWDTYSSTLADETEAHSPPMSCRVCSAQDAYFYVAQTVPVALKAGQRYLGKAWVRTATDAGAPKPVAIVIEGTDIADVTVEYKKGAGPPVTSTWTEIQTVLDVQKSTGVKLNFRVGPDLAQPGECVIVDDASLVQIQ